MSHQRIINSRVILLLIFTLLPGIVFPIIPTRDICEKKFGEVTRMYPNFDDRIREWALMREYCPKDGSFEQIEAAIYTDAGKDLEWIKYAERELLKYQSVPVKFAYALATVYIEQKNYDAANKVAQKMIKQYPNQFEGYRIQGVISLSKKEYTNALHHLWDSHQKDGGRNAWNYISIAYCLYHLSEYQQSAKNLFKA